MARSTPLTAACHQPVEVGAAYQRELCAERDAGYDVSSVPDAGVNDHLDVFADLAQQVKRDGRTVELAPAVV